MSWFARPRHYSYLVAFSNYFNIVNLMYKHLEKVKNYKHLAFRKSKKLSKPINYFLKKQNCRILLKICAIHCTRYITIIPYQFTGIKCPNH